MTSMTVNGVRISFCKKGTSVSVPVGKGLRIRKNSDGSTSVVMKREGISISKNLGKGGD